MGHEDWADVSNMSRVEARHDFVAADHAESGLYASVTSAELPAFVTYRGMLE